MNICSKGKENGVVVFYPFGDGNRPKRIGPRSNDDLLNASIDDLALAHGAGHGVGKQGVGFGVPADQIESRPDHIPPGGGDDGIRFRVYAPAEFIALTGGNIQGFAGTDPEIGTVFSSSGSTVIACGYDLIVTNDQSAVFAPKTGGSFQNRICNVQIVILFTGSGVQNPHTLS